MACGVRREGKRIVSSLEKEEANTAVAPYISFLTGVSSS